MGIDIGTLHNMLMSVLEGLTLLSSHSYEKIQADRCHHQPIPHSAGCQYEPVCPTHRPSRGIWQGEGIVSVTAESSCFRSLLESVWWLFCMCRSRLFSPSLSAVVIFLDVISLAGMQEVSKFSIALKRLCVAAELSIAKPWAKWKGWIRSRCRYGVILLAHNELSIFVISFPLAVDVFYLVLYNSGCV